VAAQVLYGWVVAPDGDPHSVLTGAVAAQVVAADLRATSCGGRRPLLGGGVDRGRRMPQCPPARCTGVGLGCGCFSR